MRFEWDENKRLINIRKHGIDFADVPAIFELDTVTVIDDRFEYGETRGYSAKLSEIFNARSLRR